jgi:serine/threonine protein kinase
MIGETLGPYRLTKELGKGGFATVYRALQPTLNRYVAIKVLHPEFTRDEKALKRFQREALAVARLSHPNIMAVYDYGEHEGRAYLVMEYIAGNTLKSRLGKPVSYSFALELIKAVGSALDYAHSKGIVHRDIKPANVLFTEDERIVLSDFGIVRLADDDSDLTRGVIGTPQYMSPEQALGREVDGRSDLYSLGVVLFEMMAGRVPYRGDSALSTLSMHATLPIPSVREFNPDVSQEIDLVVQQALAKQPEERYPTGAAMQEALSAAIAAGERSMAPTIVVTTSMGDPSATVSSQSVPTPWPADLDSMYQQLLAFTRVRDWRSAISLAAQIVARDANYRDVNAIMATATNELRYGRSSTSVRAEMQNIMSDVDTAVMHERFMEAAAMLQQVLRNSPSDTAARARLDEVHRLMEEQETRRRRLARLDQLYDLARSKLASGDLHWANHIFEEISGLDPNYRDVPDRLIELRAQLAPEEAPSTPGERIAALRDQAEAAMTQEHWAEAVDLWEQLLAQVPNMAGAQDRIELARHQAHVTALNSEVAKLAADGKFEEAIQKLEEIKRLTHT